MRHRFLPLFAALSAIPALAVAAPASAADAPPNDDRANAQAISLPSTVGGTTVGATTESGEPTDFCGSTAGSVWYRFKASEARGVVVSLQAGGNLDAELDVFQQRRSHLDGIACDQTDDNGQAAAGFRTTAGATYLVRVAEQPNTEHNTFQLSFVQGPPPSEPPGAGLPPRGARGSLDGLLRVDAAYHVNLKAARPYLVNLVHSPDVCMSLDLFAPGTSAFDKSSPVLSLGCGGFGVFTPPPGTGGRYVMRVGADRGRRATQPYTLLLGAAGRDDIAPGMPLRNFERKTGSVNGGSLDALDLYRFDVARRSALDLDLRTQADGNLDLELRTDTGRQLACACFASGSHFALSLRVGRGRYYVAVRSRDLDRSTYVLSRRSRTITSTSTLLNGRRNTSTPPQHAVRIRVHVPEINKGRATMAIDHLDPFQGWLPAAQRTVTLRAGSAVVRWVPPTIGRWRVRAEYAGARRFAPSRSRFATLLVADPLTQQALRALR